MNGMVITGTPIAIDFWQLKKCPGSKVFFLSHAHSDHTAGLSSTWRQPIYCSDITGKIAVAKLGVQQSLIKTLSIGESHIIPLDENGKETMTVTLLDANHCPGATMFVFEGYFGRFLYTGDFRYQPTMFSNPVLKMDGSIDRLYLDNTYNTPASEFPSELDCKMRIMEILANHPHVNVVIGMHQLGKEDLLVDIANFFEESIQVSPERMAMIDLLECDRVFTTTESRIRVVQVHTITLGSVERWNSEIPTIVIIPSAIFRAHRKSHIEKHPRVFVVPYSSHSSCSELMQFVKGLKPRKVIPIVHPPPSKGEECSISDVSNFDDCLDPSPATTFSIPACVDQFMNSSSALGGIKKLPPRKTHSFKSDKRKVAAKIAKGVVFEDINDDDDIRGKSNSNDHVPLACQADLEISKSSEEVLSITENKEDERRNHEIPCVLDMENLSKKTQNNGTSGKQVSQSVPRVCDDMTHEVTSHYETVSGSVVQQTHSGETSLDSPRLLSGEKNAKNDFKHGRKDNISIVSTLDNDKNYNDNTGPGISLPTCGLSNKGYMTPKKRCLCPVGDDNKALLGRICITPKRNKRDYHMDCYKVMQKFYTKAKAAGIT